MKNFKEIEKLKMLWESGVHINEIMNITGLKQYTIYRYAKKHFKKRRKVFPVERKRKIDENKRELIEKLYFDKKYKQKSIANRFGVSDACIGLFIRKGERYKSGERRI